MVASGYVLTNAQIIAQDSNDLNNLTSYLSFDWLTWVQLNKSLTSGHLQPSTGPGYYVKLPTGIYTAAKAVATANITLSGNQTVDTVALVDNDICLVTGQTTASENGLYTVQTGAWTRHPDLIAGFQAVEGSLCAIKPGGSNGGSIYFLVDSATTIDTDPLTFQKVAGSSGVIGDMLKSVYDSNDDGIVDAADLAALATLATEATDIAGSPVAARYYGTPTGGTTKGFNAFPNFASLDTAQAFTAAKRSTPSALTITSGAVTINANLSNYFTLELTENVTTVSITNLAAGARFDLEVYQDSTGGRTVVGWPGNMTWPGGTAPVFSGGADAEEMVISILSRDGTVLKGIYTSGEFS